MNSILGYHSQIIHYPIYINGDINDWIGPSEDDGEGLDQDEEPGQSVLQHVQLARCYIHEALHCPDQLDHGGRAQGGEQGDGEGQLADGRGLDQGVSQGVREAVREDGDAAGNGKNIISFVILIITITY